MFLYLLASKKVHGYDTHDSMVVVAENEKQARELAALKGVNEEWWLEESDSNCIPLSSDAIIAIPAVVCASFNAG